ncbi:integrator complex subunit 12-like [Paramacrobiotus metropolitanus]|uniref:integrator complex subunit 12-like n=1 Tax=Paramacrobiotus metropolitanus TaxID=2943436 RepID=UPI002445B37D|nr:integrator complex subunit 12-like [Paramacrobiotus metropolitanus]
MLQVLEIVAVGIRMEADVEMRQITSAAPGMATEDPSTLSAVPLSQNVVRPNRASSPDFPTHPSPEMPLWLTKCLKLLALHTPEAGEEIGRMMDEALDRRSKLDEAAASGNPMPKIIPLAKAAVPGKIPAAPVVKKPDFPAKSKLPTKPEGQPMAKRPKFSPSSTPVPLGPKSSSDPTMAASVSPALDDDASVEVLVSGTSGDNVDDTEVETDLSALLGEDACTVCGETNQSSGNDLLKCYECKKYYHQLCHKPPLVDVNPDDPRFVFYCSECTKKQKKQSEKAEAKPQSPTKIVPIPSKPKSAAASGLTPSSSSSQLFKRAEPKATVSNISATGAGLAKLAAGAKTAKQHRGDKDAKKIKLIDPPAPPKKT